MKKILKALGMALLCAVLLAAFYLAVIMGDPQEASAVPAQEQPLLPALSAPLLIQDGGQLGALTAQFPAPVLAALNTSALTFVQGLCQDTPFEDGLARTVTLAYQTAVGSVTVTSIYPARALSLVEREDYSFTDAAIPSLAGLRAIRMENASTVRLHAQGDEALYVVTLPRAYGDSLRDVTSVLQLYQGE